MIEPFEFESIRLEAPKPTGTVGKTIIQGKGTIDEKALQSFSSLKQGDDAIRLDTQQLRVYQTKIGNPASYNTHKAEFVNERILSKPPLAVNHDDAIAPTPSSKSSSELLHHFLDTSMSYIPSTDKHHMPPFHVNSLDSPFLSPGLTSIDAHKVHVNWS